MSDESYPEKKKSQLTLRGSSGLVKQNFSHGRVKSVVVETKRKKLIISKPNPLKSTQSIVGSSDQKHSLNISADLERKRKALEAAKHGEANRIEKEKADRKKREVELEALRLSKKVKEDSKDEKRLNVSKLNDGLPTEPVIDKPRSKQEKSSSKYTSLKKSRAEDEESKKVSRSPEDRRRSGKLTIVQALGEEGGRHRSIASMKRRQEKEKRRLVQENQEREKVIRDVQIPDSITVQELANRMAERSAAVVKTLMTNGIMATQNQIIDSDTATLIVEEFGHKPIRVSESDIEDSIVKYDESDDGEKSSRPPIITIMGHVDHGKTTLLDAIKNTNVVSSEAGGITQHIGAYQVKTKVGTLLTFIDTPGHSAFTSMRARGAQVTDIVVLVVAADDGVMPQTIEAINHAKAANVPIIVAINKSDKADADPNRVRTELLQHEVIVESMSGEVLEVEVSALKSLGLDKLLDAISLQSEILELKANENRPAEAAVIEAKLDVGKGPIATVLVLKGTLKTGDIFVVGCQWGKVRALLDDTGSMVNIAKPSVPVEVLGLNGTPEAGDLLNVVSDESKARELSNYRMQLLKDKKAALGSGTSFEQLLANAKNKENISELPVLVKSDVQGSAEAIVQALNKVGNDEVIIKVLYSGVGAITESDILLAEASRSPVVGFNVRANAPARELANQKNVEIKYFSIIYDLVDTVKGLASGLLAPKIEETFIGYAEIKQVFKVSDAGKIAGCLITEGIAKKEAGVRLLRENIVIHQGKLKTLKRFKDDAKEVQSGQECGMAFENYEDIRENDVIEIFTTKEIDRSL